MRILSLLLLLGACGTLNLSTLIQLSRLDPLTANPDGFVAAIILPEEMDVPEGAATLGFTWATAQKTIGGHYTLRRQTALADYGLVPSAGQQVLFFDLTPEDAAQIRQTQQQIIAQKAEGIEGKGRFSVFAAPCARGPVASPLLSTYIQVESGGAFLPLLRNYDINNAISERQLPDMPLCRQPLARP